MQDDYELLEAWVQIAREGVFGAEFIECESDCDCVVCETENFLENEDRKNERRNIRIN